jgi:hypothetical protein
MHSVNWRKQPWVLKKSVLLKSHAKNGDRKSVGDQRKSFTGHPGAM